MKNVILTDNDKEFLGAVAALIKDRGILEEECTTAVLGDAMREVIERRIQLSQNERFKEAVLEKVYTEIRADIAKAAN